MKTDLISSDLISNPSNDADTLYKQYHTTLTTLIDKHAPLHTKHTKAKYIPGWVNNAVIAAKETKRLFERIWRRNKSHFNRYQYMQKSTNTTEPASRPNPNFLKQRFRIIIMTPKIMGSPWRCVTQTPSQDATIDKSPLGSWPTDLWSSSQKKLKKYVQLFLSPRSHNTLPQTLLPQCFPPSLLLLRIK